MRIPPIAAALVALASSVVPAAGQEAEEPEPAVTVEVKADLVSHYMWHGFDLAEGGPLLQPEILLSHRSGVWFSVWGSVALSGRRHTLSTGEARRDVDELDLSLGITREVRGLEVEVAAEWYGYPNVGGYPGDGTSSLEPYVSVKAGDLPLSPSLMVRYDVDVGDGWSVEGGVEHADSLGAFEVTGAATAAWMRQVWRLTDDGEKEAGLSDATISLDVSRTFGRFTIAPAVAWTRLFEGDTTPGDDTVWGRLSVTYSP